MGGTGEALVPPRTGMKRVFSEGNPPLGRRSGASLRKLPGLGFSEEAAPGPFRDPPPARQDHPTRAQGTGHTPLT